MFARIKSFDPLFYRWIFLLLLFLVSFAYSYHEILRLRPQSIHQWRQSDCLSITMNYFMEDRSFLEPSVHRIGKCENGKAVSEFPIIYYTVAKLWKLFGHKESVFRLLNTLIMFCGLFALFKLIEEILKHSIWAILLTLFFFTSPILVYYGNNFTADVPALSMALIGWLLFWRFYKTDSNKIFSISVLFFLTGILLKASSALSFACIGLLFLLEFFNIIKIKKNEKLFKHPWKQSLGFIVPVITCFIWYSYASNYNNQNNPGLFLIGTLPVWELNKVSIVSVGRAFWNELLPQYFNQFALALIGVMFILLIVFWKKVNTVLLITVFAMFGGFIAFFLLFYKVLDVHDYYLVNMLIIIPAVLLCFFVFLKQNFFSVFDHRAFKIAFFLLLGTCIYYTSRLQSVKYHTAKDNKPENYPVFLTNSQVEYWRWFHWDYDNHFRALESITPYLRSIGIKRTDRVYSTPDKSINISLYLMDQKGWTDYGHSEYGANEKEFMDHITDHGAEYLIINDPEKLKDEIFQPYLAKKIGEYKNVQIFSLK